MLPREHYFLVVSYWYFPFRLGFFLKSRSYFIHLNKSSQRKALYVNFILLAAKHSLTMTVSLPDTGGGREPEGQRKPFVATLPPSSHCQHFPHLPSKLKGLSTKYILKIPAITYYVPLERKRFLSFIPCLDRKFWNKHLEYIYIKLWIGLKGSVSEPLYLALSYLGAV